MDLTKLPSHHNEERGYIGWSPFGDSMTSNGGMWNSALKFPDWTSFASEFDNADADYNVVVNFYFEEQDEDVADSPTSFNMWMLHPRKGASRGVHIHEVTEDDVPLIKDYLKKHRDTVTNWFAWVSE